MSGFPSPLVLRLLALACVVAAGLTLADMAVEGGDIDVLPLVFDFVERLLLLGAIAALGSVVIRLGSLEQRTEDLGASLARAHREGADWRRNSRALIRTLSQSIDHQFKAWGLTEAEADIAALMLKGVSTRDIGRLRKTSESTIRQQAQGIYRKSGLRNRVELSAYFLDDLFSVVEDGLDPPVRVVHPPLRKAT